MKKIILLTMIISLICITCACSKKVNVTYEEDYSKYTKTDTLHKQTEEEITFIEKLKTEQTEEFFGEHTTVNFLTVKETQDVLEHGTGVILFANIDSLSDENKITISNFIESAQGAAYPINYYGTGNEADDKKILKKLNGSITDFNNPIVIFLKEGQITSIKNINEIASDNQKEIYQIFKQEVYKTLTE